MLDEKNLISKKIRGRPRTGIGHLIAVRFAPELLAKIDDWIRSQPDPKPSRPEAIRALIRERFGEK